MPGDEGAREPELGHLDMEIADGVMRLLEEQKRRLEMAIKIADDFKASDATPIVSAGPQSEQGKMSEEELAAALEKDEAELAGLQKQVDDAKKELGDVRAQIAAKKGESPPELRADALKDVPTNAAAEKWLEENFSGIHKSIAEQGERLQAILAEADKCEQSVSRSARLRTRRLNCKNKIPFLKLALPQIEEAVERAKGELAKL